MIFELWKDIYHTSIELLNRQWDRIVEVSQLDCRKCGSKLPPRSGTKETIVALCTTRCSEKYHLMSKSGQHQLDIKYRQNPIYCPICGKELKNERKFGGIKCRKCGLIQ